MSVTQKQDGFSNETLLIMGIAILALLGGGSTMLIAAADWLGNLGVLIRPAPIEIPLTKGWGIDVPRAFIIGGSATAIGVTVTSFRRRAAAS